MNSTPPTRDMPVRAAQILRVRKIWLLPVAIAAVFVALMSVIYIGSVVDPTAQLHNLPVEVVNEDTGATVHNQRVDVGADLVTALRQSSGVSSHLQLRTVTLSKAQATMSRGGAYSALVIPATLTRSVLVSAGDAAPSSAVPARASVELLENQRLGSLGTNLASGVITPAIAQISPQVGSKLKDLATPSAAANPVSAAQLADPVSLTTATYRPLPAHSALGLSAFYIALIAIMSGFVGSTLINSSIDSALGYAATELGPRWRHRRPVAIGRRQTLLVKWCAAVVAAPVLTGVLMLIAVVALRMYAPDVLLLWLLTAFASLMIATGTLTLLAIFGSLGQLLAMIVLVYLSLASSGGTVPIDALPGVFRIVGEVEPLRQTLSGTRAIMYFGAHGDAGLTHSLILIGAELAFWALLGLVVTSLYDRRGLYRLTPDLFAFIDRTIDQRLEQVDDGSGRGVVAEEEAADSEVTKGRVPESPSPEP